MSSRFAWLCAWLILAAGCASEEWDNRYDPDSSEYAQPCASAPAAQAKNCIFWEGFENGLARWYVDPGAAKASTRASVSGTKDRGILVIPGCLKQSATLAVEIAIPQRPSVARVYWKPASSSSEGTLLFLINGESVFAQTEDAVGEMLGWKQSSVILDDVAGTEITAVLSAKGDSSQSCSEASIWVASFAVHSLVF